MLAKLAEHNRGNWNLFLTQALAAVRFSINETTKFSPNYLVYGRDVVLPIDNLSRPRRKYLEEDHHRIILEQQHKIFTQVRRRIRRAQKKRNGGININREEVSFKIRDPVYYKIHLRDGKLDQRWCPYYRIVEQTCPLSFVIWDQLTGKVRRVHANDIKLAGIKEWKVDGVATRQKKPRRATLVEPEMLESDSEASEAIEISPTTLQRLREITRPPVGLSEKETVNPSDNEEDRSSDKEPDDEFPLGQLRNQRQAERTPDDGRELPLKLRLRGATPLE